MIPSESSVTSFACIAAGTLLGVLRPQFLHNLEHRSPMALDALLSLLLFSSSLTFGSDPAVTESLSSIGLVSAVTALFALVASASAAILWRGSVGRSISFSRRGPEFAQAAATLSCQENKTGARETRASGMRWSGALPAIMVLGGWSAGMAIQSGPAAFSGISALAGTISSLSLSALLLVVGYEMGKGRIWNRLREYGVLAATLPMVTGFASVAAAGLASLLFSLPLSRGLAAGSGFGWYSLAGAMTLAEKGAEAGAYVFLSNLFREIVTLAAVPLIAGRTSPEVAASMGGATSMDSTLPVISRAFGPDGAAWGLITGTTLSIACPIVLGFLLKL